MTPAAAAQTNRVQSGQLPCAPAASPASARMLRAAASGSTRVCPWRSTRRDIHGASKAVDSENVAATAPANA